MNNKYRAFISMFGASLALASCGTYKPQEPIYEDVPIPADEAAAAHAKADCISENKGSC
jgi:hypothetical protein